MSSCRTIAYSLHILRAEGPEDRIISVSLMVDNSVILKRQLQGTPSGYQPSRTCKTVKKRSSGKRRLTYSLCLLNWSIVKDVRASNEFLTRRSNKKSFGFRTLSLPTALDLFSFIRVQIFPYTLSYHLFVSRTVSRTLA